MRLQVCRKRVVLYGSYKQSAKWRLVSRSSMTRRARNNLIVEAKRKKKIKVRELGPDEGFDMSMVEYLKFGQLVGDTPEEVILNLEEKGFQPTVDKQTEQFYQRWDEAERADYQFHKSLAEYEDQAASSYSHNQKLQPSQNFASADDCELTGYHQEEFAVREKRLQTRTQALQKLNNRREFMDKWSSVTTTNGKGWGDVIPSSIDVVKPVGRDLVELSEKAGELSDIVSVGINQHQLEDQQYNELFDDEDDSDLSYEEFEKLLSQEQSQDDKDLRSSMFMFGSPTQVPVKVPELVRPSKSPDGSPYTSVVKPQSYKQPARLQYPKIEKPKPLPKPKLLTKPSRDVEEGETDEEEEDSLTLYERTELLKAAFNKEIEVSLGNSDFQGLLSGSVSTTPAKPKKSLINLQRPELKKPQEEEQEYEEEDDEIEQPITLNKEDYLDIRLTTGTTSTKQQLLQGKNKVLNLAQKPQRQIESEKSEGQNKVLNLAQKPQRQIESEKIKESNDDDQEKQVLSKQNIEISASKTEPPNLQDNRRSNLELSSKPQRKQAEEEEEEVEEKVELNKEDYLDIKLVSGESNTEKKQSQQDAEEKQKSNSILDKLMRPFVREQKQSESVEQKVGEQEYNEAGDVQGVDQEQKDSSEDSEDFDVEQSKRSEIVRQESKDENNDDNIISKFVGERQIGDDNIKNNDQKPVSEKQKDIDNNDSNNISEQSEIDDYNQKLSVQENIGKSVERENQEKISEVNNAEISGDTDSEKSTISLQQVKKEVEINAEQKVPELNVESQHESGNSNKSFIKPIAKATLQKSPQQISDRDQSLEKEFKQALSRPQRSVVRPQKDTESTSQKKIKSYELKPSGENSKNSGTSFLSRDDVMGDDRKSVPKNLQRPSSNIFSLKAKRTLSKAGYTGDVMGGQVGGDSKGDQEDKPVEKPVQPVKLQPTKRQPEKPKRSREEIDKANETIKLAKKLQEDQTILDFEIVSVNKGGFICQSKEVGLHAAFLAIRAMWPDRVNEIMNKWMGLGQHDQNNKRLAMQGYVGKYIKACVYSVTEEGAVYISEKSASQQSRVWSEEDIRFLGQNIGSEVDAVVTGITDFGLFVRFELEKDDKKVQGIGIVHKSEITWSTNEASLEEFEMDQKLRVVLVVADVSRKYVSLSIRQLEDNPVMQSLDLMKQRSDGANGEEEDVDNDEDLEDMPVVEELIELLTNQPGVLGVKSKMRVKGRASAQELQVFMSKDVEDNSGGLFGYSLLVRLGLDVQELLVTASLERTEFKELLALVVQDIQNN